ncbi:MAG: bifunctional DNA primase/polymerase [Dehalococcoidia bacterium]
MTSPILTAVAELLDRGFAPVPVLTGQKGPNTPGWQKLRLDRETAPEHFSADSNVGLLNGEPSNWLIDVDLDDDITLLIAAEFLPTTNMVSGRPSRPRSHRWYRVTAPVRTLQFRADDGGMLVEVRSTGTQTIVPPSRHPSGEELIWHEFGDPAVVEPEVLVKGVRHLVAATLLAKHWPEVGARNSFALAVAGYLLRGAAE